MHCADNVEAGLACLKACVAMLQVVQQAEKLVARLQRLDEVVPRYQQVLSSLYDLLSVRGLDEVVPAVAAALQPH